ncbi:MAG: hypothetical protein R2911_21370 [Caldilineaceae bacterium]
MRLETRSPATYRRYILGKHGLWPGCRWPGRQGRRWRPMRSLFFQR